jgi:hypothetical protein
MKQSERGSSLLVILVAIVLLGAVGFVGWRVLKKPVNTNSGGIAQTPESKNSTDVNWVYNGKDWAASGEAPSCPDPLTIKSPTDIKKATSVLYPGQTRGGNYKPHGGLRFDGLANDAVTVSAPMDMHLVEGSRYIERGETQYLLVFQNSCGLAIRFDHLLTLSEAMQKAADKLPAAQVDDSRTTPFTPTVNVKDGEVIATAVGFKKTQNVGFDFGVYDLRIRNLASKNATYSAARQAEGSQAFYAVCWVNMLKDGDAAIALALPGADQVAGKTSDYC